MTVAGIDISHYQAQTPPLGNIGFVFVKATEGTSIDPKWPQHSANVRASTAVLGAYHFGRKDVSIPAQVRAFLNTAASTQLLALDVEGTYAFSPTQVGAFMAGIHAAGKRCGLYMSESGFYRNAGQDWNWVANWSAEPRLPYAFWQYGPRQMGTVKVDGDRFAGTALQLQVLAGLTVTPPESSTAGDDMPESIAAGGLGLASDKCIDLKAGTPLRSDTTTIPTTLSKDATVDYMGQSSGYYFVLVESAAFYADGISRPTQAMVLKADAPAPRTKTDAELANTAARYGGGFSQADMNSAHDAGYAEAKRKASAVSAAAIGGI